MGNALIGGTVAIAPEPHHSKVQQMRPPTPPLPSRRVRYRLPFSLSISSCEDDAPLDEEQIQKALGICLFKGVWQPYLEAAMDEAWLLSVNKDKDSESEDITLRVPIDMGTKCLLVVIERTATAGFYQGYVCWKSRAVPLADLQDVLEWHIGDRMASYEIVDDDGRWCCCIEPGEVSCE